MEIYIFFQQGLLLLWISAVDKVKLNSCEKNVADFNIPAVHLHNSFVSHWQNANAIPFVIDLLTGNNWNLIQAGNNWVAYFAHIS